VGYERLAKREGIQNDSKMHRGRNSVFK